MVSNLKTKNMDTVYSCRDPWKYGERNRHAIIIGLINQFGKMGKVLEIGCGEGLLTKKIPMRFKSDYVAVDVSGVALDRAKALNCEEDCNIEWVEDKIEDFISNTRYKFDTIIVSDVMMFLKAPKKCWFQEFMVKLKKSGIYIETTWHSDDHGACNFPWMEYQSLVTTLFVGKALVDSDCGKRYTANYYVGECS